MRPVANPQKDKRALVVMPDDGISHIDRKHMPVVKELMAQMPHARESFEERQERLGLQRVKYSAMQTHQEMAATALAAGATYKIAAAKAGISVRQVKKYYTQADFRARIEELRQTTFSKIRGRILKELEKRTDPEHIRNIELLDLLRVHDRVFGAPGGNKSGVNIQGDVNVGTTQYDTIIAALLAPESRGEEPDFPIFEPTDLSSPSDGAPE
jgi:hypothetical protein